MFGCGPLGRVEGDSGEPWEELIKVRDARRERVVKVCISDWSMDALRWRDVALYE
ncbi:unnamed protein product [Acidithrix sp. C25]|nr:unnamed protein product [Acidithrix sp. C25]